jgi:hypothetical protein
MNAQNDRQYLARQLYLRLLAVTGLSPSGAIPANPKDAELQPRRWLAQLAVNMVDYIDNDDVSTAFNFYTLQDANNDKNFDLAATVALPGPNYPGKNPPVITSPRYWVFGTEQPRVVINEVLAEYTPAPANPAPTPGTTQFLNNVWVELYNPMDSAATASTNANVNTADRGAVDLGLSALTAAQTQNGTNGAIPKFPGGYAAYQVILADQVMLPTSAVNPITDNNNVLGLPLNVRNQTIDADFGLTAQGHSPVLNVANGNSINTTATATPARLAPQDFLILAPPPNTTVNPPSKTLPGFGLDYNATITVKDNNHPNGIIPPGAAGRVVASGGMQYASTYNTATTYLPNDTKNGLTVVLQRLANPHIPPNANAKLANGQPNPWYNPYVTIDYVEHVPLNDTNGTGYASVAKKQPYASHMIANLAGANPVPQATSLVVNTPAAAGGVIHHTFGQPNNGAGNNLVVPVSGHCDWLVQLDRVVTSPIELLHVSQFQPHQLMQKFMIEDVLPTAAGSAALRYQHAPVSTWFDESIRLYRLFEFLEVHDRAFGATAVGDNGRTTGKININAIWDVETFRALCDAQGCNYFTQADVDAIWATLLTLRSPNYAAGKSFTQNGSLVGANDRPFLGNAQGFYAPDVQNPQGRGIDDTMFRAFTAGSTPAARRLFDLPPATMTTLGTDNPYVRSELLTKIANNVTSRSNVFAVWLTVGFFEVRDSTTRPVTLGAEMNFAEGRAVRHRMFAIVDRSVLPSNPYPTVFPVLPTATLPFAVAPTTPWPYRPSLDKSGVVPHWAIID